MSVNDSVIERYVAIFNERDPEQRRDLVGWTFTEDATYVDPLLLGKGHDNLDQMFAQVQAQLPGGHCSLVGEPDGHHGWVRFRWQLVMPGETESVIEGTDLARIADDGRFAQVIGFLDKVPASIAS